MSGSLWSPRFPRAKEVGWWIVLGTEEGELLALKRVRESGDAWLGGRGRRLSASCVRGYDWFDKHVQGCRVWKEREGGRDKEPVILHRVRVRVRG